MSIYTLDLPDEIFQSISKITKKSFRSISQEICFRLDRALKIHQYVPDDLFDSLLETIKNLSESQNVSEWKNFVNCFETPKQ